MIFYSEKILSRKKKGKGSPAQDRLTILKEKQESIGWLS
jgi:hypothetical protein